MIKKLKKDALDYFFKPDIRKKNNLSHLIFLMMSQSMMITPENSF